jgi:hypothetical protein
MQQEPRCGVLLVRIEALSDGDKPHAATFEGLYVVQAIHQGTPESIELPTADGIYSPRPGIRHHAVEARPAALAAAHGVLIKCHKLPAARRDVLSEFRHL